MILGVVYSELEYTTKFEDKSLSILTFISKKPFLCTFEMSAFHVELMTVSLKRVGTEKKGGKQKILKMVGWSD